LHDRHAATIMPILRRRIPILIVAPFQSRLPRYNSDTPFGAEAEKWLDYYDSDVFDARSMKYALGRIANQRISPMSHTVKLWS